MISERVIRSLSPRSIGSGRSGHSSHIFSPANFLFSLPGERRDIPEAISESSVRVCLFRSSVSRGQRLRILRIIGSRKYISRNDSRERYVFERCLVAAGLPVSVSGRSRACSCLGSEEIRMDMYAAVALRSKDDATCLSPRSPRSPPPSVCLS